MSEFDHAMQGQNIAALQSMRHYQEGASEGPGSGIGFDSSFAWFLKSGLYDHLAAITGNIDNIMPSLFNSIFSEKFLPIFSQKNTTIFGLPELARFFSENGDRFGAEDMASQMQEPGSDSFDSDMHSFMGDYPNANHNIMDTLGEDAYDFSHMQHSPMHGYDHAPMVPQQERDAEIGHSL